MLGDWPITFIDYDKKISINRHKTGYGVDVHTHAFCEIEYVVSGSCRQEISGVSYEFRRGDIAVFKPEARHAYHALGELEVINIVVDPDFFPNVYGVYNKEFNNGNIIHIPANEIDRFENIIYTMEREFKEHKDLFLEVLAGYVEVLIAMIIRINRNKNEKKLPTFDFTMLISYIEKNLETVTPKAVSEYSGYNYSYFSKMFKKQMGLNLSEYINCKRLEAAQKLLSESDETIESISYKVGFNQKSYFHRLFKNHYGITPDEYRKAK